jgi:tRNA threonylcarbamoyl adenosine modification protein YeaZ
MKILALEFSSPQRSVAVVDAGTEAAPTPVLREVVETGGRSVNALGMIETALRDAKVEREQIGCLAIGIGPGSYTGIRVAIALAQGWQLASGDGGVKLLGVSSPECVAAQARAVGVAGKAAVVMDAQRGEFYEAVYELDAAGWHEVERLRLASLAEVQARQAAGALILGPEVTNWFPEGRVIFPRAAMLGQIARGRTNFIPGEKMEPIYLRETAFVKAPPARILPA